MSGYNFPDPMRLRDPLQPGALSSKAGPTLEERLAALERGALGRPGPGVSNGSTITSDTTQTGGVKWAAPDIVTYPACSIATAQALTSATYTTMTTPDQVTGVVVPTNGILFIQYDAEILESVIGTVRAAIFIGANQLKMANGTASPVVQETAAKAGAANTYNKLYTTGNGLAIGDSGTAYGGDVTTGQVIGYGVNTNQPVTVRVAAGTYTISVQFKISGGATQNLKNRNLRVWVQAFD